MSATICNNLRNHNRPFCFVPPLGDEFKEIRKSEQGVTSGGEGVIFNQTKLRVSRLYDTERTNGQSFICSTITPCRNMRVWHYLEY